MNSGFSLGDIYEDGFFHPCICFGIEDGFIWGGRLLMVVTQELLICIWAGLGN